MKPASRGCCETRPRFVAENRDATRRFCSHLVERVSSEFVCCESSVSLLGAGARSIRVTFWSPIALLREVLVLPTEHSSRFPSRFAAYADWPALSTAFIAHSHLTCICPEISRPPGLSGERARVLHRGGPIARSWPETIESVGGGQDAYGMKDPLSGALRDLHFACRVLGDDGVRRRLLDLIEERPADRHRRLMVGPLHAEGARQVQDRAGVPARS
jgi:hypothetical protein